MTSSEDDVRITEGQLRQLEDLSSQVTEAVLKALPDDARESTLRVINFRKTLSNESDRGSAMMGAAFIEDRLEALLAAFMVDDTTVIKPLFEFNGPFGTFSSKIDAAYAFGLIPGNVRRDIHMLRKIRNDFGHRWEALSFSDEPIVARCRELALDGMARNSEPRGKFNRSMLAAVACIEAAIGTIERRGAVEPHDISVSASAGKWFADVIRSQGFNDAADLFERAHIRKRS